MYKLKRVCYALVLAFLPIGCNNSAPPTAPAAASVKDSGPAPEPPKAVKRGMRTVHPGGAGTATP